MALVDTNILLRWLLADNAKLTAKAESIISTARAGGLLVTDLVCSEIVYVLRATGRDRMQTGAALELLISTPAFAFENNEIIVETVGLFKEHNLDFADCYLAAKALKNKLALHTFDDKLQQLHNTMKPQKK